MALDIDELVREARELRERLAVTVIRLDVFTQQLQANVDRLRQISIELAEEGTPSDDPTSS